MLVHALSKLGKKLAEAQSTAAHVVRELNSAIHRGDAIEEKKAKLRLELKRQEIATICSCIRIVSDGASEEVETSLYQHFWK